MSDGPVYDHIGSPRHKFVNLVRRALTEGISHEYAGRIAEAMADKVAEDIEETADLVEWNACDVDIGIGRVLLKALGVEE